MQDNENYFVTEDGVLVHNGCGKFDNELPTLDNTGKVHGELPDIQNLDRYSDGALEILHDELKQSVQTRIQVTSDVGGQYTPMQNKQHGERQAAEQALIKAIEKYLNL